MVLALCCFVLGAEGRVCRIKVIKGEGVRERMLSLMFGFLLGKNPSLKLRFGANVTKPPSQDLVDVA